MARGEQAVGESPEGLLSISTLEDGKGLEIMDRIERRHLALQTPRNVSPKRISADSFVFPVSQAVSIWTRKLTVPHQLGVVVRNSLGLMVAEMSGTGRRHFPRDTYSLDPAAPIKSYIRFESPFTIETSSEGVVIQFDSVTKVSIGVRSHHKRPAGTISTTERPRDLMKAVSYLGSAMKTTSCERSYPTLRGHPPMIGLAEKFHVPAVISRPETGMTMEMPLDLSYIYSSATLAYYLGAELVPGESARIVTNSGFEHDLGSSLRTFESEVEKVLKQLFFLDCITRTEGYFQVNLYERNELEKHLDLDFEYLYEAPLSTQLESYLEVPYSQIRPLLPRWKLTACVTPKPEYSSTIPFLVNSLAIIKSPDSSVYKKNPGDDKSFESLNRGTESTTGPIRSAKESTQQPNLIRVQANDSLEQTWVGEGAPVGASKAMTEAFQNRIDRQPSNDSIDITVVCNADEMSQESDLVNTVYGSREELPFDVSIHQGLSVEELEKVLMQDIAFLHYIGHIDQEGFECTDGKLDVSKIDHTGVEVFFLNACTSYDQGKNLIKAGSIAGVVTLEDIINSGAERVGMMLARLLNWGFPLRTALGIAQKKSIMGGHYLVIGDGSVDIAQPRVGIQGVNEIAKTQEGWNLQFLTFPTRDLQMGAIVTMTLRECDEFFLVSGSTKQYRISTEELSKYLQEEEMPIRYGNDIMWSSEFLEDIP